MKNECSCMSVPVNQRETMSHDGYPCVRFHFGSKISAVKVGHLEWIPTMNDKKLGRRTHLTKDEAIGIGQRKAENEWRHANPKAPSTDYECAGSVKDANGNWDWNAITRFHVTGVVV